MASDRRSRKELLWDEMCERAHKIGCEASPTGKVPYRWIVAAIAEGIRREHGRADRAMARVFKRLSGCQKTRKDAGVCGQCLLVAVTDWRRYTRPRRANG